MKAIVYHRYGPPEVLECKEIAKPAPGANEVLIKVRAASLNPYDWHLMRGTPGFIRLFTGLRKPKSPHFGADASGFVEAVGSNVTQFQPGDAVFGTCRGACAEYACAAESTLATKPASITFEQAAGVPIAALTALQSLHDKARVQPGQKVLVNGAAGGVGTFAVQIAKKLGAEVTGVCSTRNLEMVRSLGADHVIDYTQKDFTRNEQKYDVVLECVGNHPFSSSRHALNPRGIYVGVGGGGPDRRSMSILAGLLNNAVLSWFTSQKVAGLIAKANRDDLEFLGELISAGKLNTVIDRCYRLNEVSDAIRYLEQGHARGKVIIVLE